MSDRPLALVCAVPRECAALRDALEGRAEAEVGRKAAWRGALDGRPVVLLPAGMGKANAAQALTALLEAEPVRGVVGFGIAGAYAGSGLAIGGVALATHLVHGDEGVEAPGGWIGPEGIGIPLVERPGVRLWDRFPLDADRVARAEEALRRAGVAVRTGGFATVSTCSGTAERGRALEARTGALVEEMEGAALAQVCALYDVALLALRAVSNRVEDRDLSRWRIDAAAETAQRAVRVVAAAWEDAEEG